MSGVAAIAGAFGLWRSLAGAAPFWLRILLLVAIIAVAAGNIWAGLYPLPDQRHRDNPFAPAFFVMPLLLCLASFVSPGLRAMRVWMTLNLLLFGAYAAVMAGITGLDLAANIGWLQRVGAFTIMGAIGLVGYYRLRCEVREREQRRPRTSTL